MDRCEVCSREKIIVHASIGTPVLTCPDSTCDGFYLAETCTKTSRGGWVPKPSTAAVSGQAADGEA